jgi:WD repeat and SOF domain-containing protein 1
MHPFAKARERTRALNAAKIERMFAKPFLASLEGHVDGVNVVVRKAHDLAVIASASADGGKFQWPIRVLLYLTLTY